MLTESNNTNIYPITKVYFIIFVIVVSVLSSELIIPYLFVLFCLFMAIFSGVIKQFLNLTIKGLLTISVIMMFFQAFFHPGELVLWSWSIFSITQEGVDFGLIITARILSIGASTILITYTTSAKDFIYSLEKIGFSPKVTYVILSTLQIVPETKKKSATIMEAQKTRGVEVEGNLLVRMKAILPSLAPLVISSIASTEERAITLESKAFMVQGNKTSLHKVEKTWKDTAITILLIVLLITFIAWRILL